MPFWIYSHHCTALYVCIEYCSLPRFTLFHWVFGHITIAHAFHEIPDTALMETSSCVHGRPLVTNAINTRAQLVQPQPIGCSKYIRAQTTNLGLQLINRAWSKTKRGVYPQFVLSKPRCGKNLNETHVAKRRGDCDEVEGVTRAGEMAYGRSRTYSGGMVAYLLNSS